MVKHTIWVGQVLEGLRLMPDESVDCCITSPPYYMLRDYGVPGQIGMETTVEEHIAVLVEIFAEIRRVLKPHGSLWLNYGDCYAAEPNGRSAAATKAAGMDDRTFRDKPGSTIQGVFKAKDLMMLPNRLAIALQCAGWWVRSEIIWGKPNSMPDSSGISRPATAHEKIFLLAKSGKSSCWRARDTAEWVFEKPEDERLPVPRGKSPDTPRWRGFDFYYNAEAVKPPRSGDEDADGFRGGSYVNGEPGKRTVTGNKRIVNSEKKQRGHSRRHNGFNDLWDQMSREEQQEGGRFLRNYEPAPVQVWKIATAAFSEAHFATFPPELVERCLRAGCPEGGVVLDPFGGAGTTAMVADYMGRSSYLIELNPDYVHIAWRRIKDANPLICDISIENMQINMFGS